MRRAMPGRGPRIGHEQARGPMHVLTNETRTLSAGLMIAVVLLAGACGGESTSTIVDAQPDELPNDDFPGDDDHIAAAHQYHIGHDDHYDTSANAGRAAFGLSRGTRGRGMGAT